MHAGRRLLASVLQPVIQVEGHFGANRLLGPRKTSQSSVTYYVCSTAAEDREPAGLLRAVVAVCCGLLARSPAVWRVYEDAVLRGVVVEIRLSSYPLGFRNSLGARGSMGQRFVCLAVRLVARSGER